VTNTQTGTTQGWRNRRVGVLTLPAFIVCSLLLAVATIGFVWAFVTSPNHPVKVLVSDAAVKAFFPRQGDQVLRQETIFIELDPAYELTDLSIAPEGAPPRSVAAAHIPGLNRYSFTPGPGKDIEALPGGLIRVTASFRPIGDSGERGRTYTWSFSTH
jgi:hypothetical protein